MKPPDHEVRRLSFRRVDTGTDHDEERTGIIGICGGAYSINFTMTERRISVASITGVQFWAPEPRFISELDPIGAHEAMAKQRTAEARGDS